MAEEVEVLRGSDNIFADFGDADAEVKMMKAKAAAEIIGTLDNRGLSVRAAAKVAHVDPSDIQRIRNADLSRFTIDRLVRIASRLGRKAEMNFPSEQPSVAA